MAYWATKKPAVTLPALSKVSLPKVSLPKGPRTFGFAALSLGTSPIGLTINNRSYAATLVDIGAWSTSSGTIEVPRTAFRIYGRHTGWLACTVAHEIAHIQRNHVFQASYYANNTMRSAPDQKQEELTYAKSRQQ